MTADIGERQGAGHTGAQGSPPAENADQNTPDKSSPETAPEGDETPAVVWSGTAAELKKLEADFNKQLTACQKKPSPKNMKAFDQFWENYPILNTPANAKKMKKLSERIANMHNK